MKATDDIYLLLDRDQEDEMDDSTQTRTYGDRVREICARPRDEQMASLRRLRAGLEERSGEPHGFYLLRGEVAVFSESMAAAMGLERAGSPAAFAGAERELDAEFFEYDRAASA